MVGYLRLSLLASVADKRMLDHSTHCVKNNYCEGETREQTILPRKNDNMKK